MTVLTITISSDDRDELQRMVQVISDEVSNCVLFTKIYDEDGMHHVKIKVDEPVDDIWFNDVSAIYTTLRSYWQQRTGEKPALPLSVDVLTGLHYYRGGK